MNALSIDRAAIATFCERHHIRWLALFGSAARDELRADSDVDLLVEFDQEHVPGLLGLAGLGLELSPHFGGRQVDLRTPEDLSRHFRDRVRAQAEVLYARG